MTDKSFGDHSNRNIVKNPLLSTAVTGLSIEDLRHNAVLLPVVSNQGLISSQDTIQSWTQTGALVDHLTTNVVATQSGDSNPNTVNANPRSDGNGSADFHAISLSQNPDGPPAGESKASAKSDDDFDVNEYFARLQGTRYVSAPLNRPLTEDSNANLDAEQNLEEINLNDNREAAGEVAQSLTADIAHNFSQLPQVLPQVASAVFSSFSSMLSLKSREQTPEYDANKRQILDNSGYQDVTFAGSQTAVAGRNLNAHPPMPTISEPSHAGVEANKPLPPKEPPRLASTSNTFRMAAKKKTYAQIPGLSSGEPGPIGFQGPSFGISPTPPTYFDPSQHNLNSPLDSIQEPSNISSSEVLSNADQLKDATVPFYNPNALGNVKNIYTQDTNVDIFASDTVAPKEQTSQTNIRVQNLNQPSLASNIQSQTSEPQKIQTGQIIPPPPMFSNLPPRNDSQSLSSVNRSVLPPSVARRIASKPPSSVMPPIDTNIFVPSQNVPDVAQITQSIPPSNVFEPHLSTNVETVQQIAKNETPAPTLQSNQSQTRVLFTPSSAMKETDSEPPSKPDITAPPTFFNPSTFNIPKETVQPWPATTSSADVQPEPFVQAPPEPPKPTPEPPKIAPGNYRLTKKRPQYYSGPIEGVGAIGNNVKPVIPIVEQPSAAYRGTFFTPPEQAAVQESTPLYSAGQSIDRTQIDHPPPAFDISKTTNLEMNSPQHTFHLNHEQNQPISQQPQFNMDFSRPTTNNYDNPKQESKGFGIIGSLKSKLGSLDINKLHNSVTTFFDPSYNDSNEAQKQTSNNLYPQSNEHSYELFVPNAEQSAQPHPSHPGYVSHHSMYQYSPYYNYPGGQKTSASSYYQSQEPFSIYQQITQPSNTTDAHYSQSKTSSIAHSFDSTVTTMTTENRNSNNDREEIVTGSFFIQPMATETRPQADNAFESKNIVQHQSATAHSCGVEMKSANPQVSYENLAQNTTETEKDLSTVTTSYNRFHNIPMNNESGYFDNLLNDAQNEGGGNDSLFNVGTIGQRRNTIEAETELLYNNAPQVQLFNASNNTLEPQNGTNHIGLQASWFNRDGCNPMMQNKPDTFETQCKGRGGNCGSIIYKRPVVSPSESETGNDLPSIDPSELDICETCREVNKHEDREPDITTQLIDNITAPIQLLNPVELSFTENIDDEATDKDGFNIAQCAEITRITQKTIEMLHGQPNDDLLCEKTDHEHNFAMVEDAYKKYSYCANIAPNDLEGNRDLDPNLDLMSIFSNGPLLIENTNILTNASDEVKAEYSIVHDDIVPLILPRQMSVPTAPAREEIDESKSDSGVIDVQLIEQDAKNDFPIFEEYVIEPSETDDGKIEYRGRERPSQERDTFTNRVERYNMAVEDNFDNFNFSLIDDFMDDGMSDPLANHSRHGLRLYESVPNITSPPMTMASYFDTGNYAAESHYKNSLTSPTSINTRAINPPNDNVSVFTSATNNTNEMAAENSIDNDDDLATEIHAKEIALETLHLALPEIFELDNEPFEEITQENPNPTNLNVQPTITESITTTSTASFVERPVLSHQEVNSASLPDAASFFSSHVSSNAPPQEVQSESDASYNRLASYFSSPAKTADNTKSFFELRQGQNHFRQTGQNENISPLNRDQNSTNDNTGSYLGAIQTDDLDRRKGNADNDAEDRSTKPFFELGLSQNHYKEAARGFSDQTYLANAQLIRDLTSIENFLPNKDSTVRTVNYFDVVYDCDNNETDVLTRICNVDIVNDKKLNDDETILQTTLSNCKYCCNNELDRNHDLDEGVGSSAMNELKVRTAMNTDSDGKGAKEGDAGGGSASGKVNKKKLSVNFEGPLRDVEEGLSETDTIENRTNADYLPVRHHWFYRVDCDGKSIWRGFSAADSRALEEAFNSPDLAENTLVPTDGGRFDVNVLGRLRHAVYWTDKPTNVMRCSWFYKGTTDARFIPYAENIANKLEEEYRHGVQTGVWHRRLALPNSEVVVMHGPAVMVHFLQSSNNDWGNSAFFGKRVYRNPPKIRVARDQSERIDHLLLLVHGAGEWRHQRQKIQSTTRPKVVRRGFDESEIEDTEPSHIDHLLLLCHGVGSACDMRFRAVEEVVDDFRATSLQLVQSHYRNSYDSGDIGRVEMLPISWHSTLHSGESGVDKRLAQITLDSIPKLRNFTNDTVLDVLFYTSPIFCQTIIDTVCKELNRIYTLFRARNPSFTGGVSLGGHSLGSVILYDLLCHQVASPTISDITTKSFVQGSAGTGQPTVRYPSLDFKPESLFALGSPIAIFECIRGVEMLGENFSLPTIEPLINPELKKLQPYLIPHHKGRKRMHLELKETMARVGSDLKQKLIESIKATWSSVWRAPPPSAAQLEQVVEEQIEKEEMLEGKDEQFQDIDMTTSKLLGRLNSGRRVDYVLQEAPFEMINEYLFAMTSHVCYWESEDTMLLMLREIYSTLGVQPDSTIPQQTMTVQRTRIFPNENDMDIGSPISDKPTTSRNSL